MSIQRATRAAAMEAPTAIKNGTRGDDARSIHSKNWRSTAGDDVNSASASCAGDELVVAGNGLVRASDPLMFAQSGVLAQAPTPEAGVFLYGSVSELLLLLIALF